MVNMTTRNPIPDKTASAGKNALQTAGLKSEASMKLKNVLIAVNDVEQSRQFYSDLFGLDLVLDNDGNMILTDGLVLQDKKI